MSETNNYFSTDNIDTYLKELAKEYRKINGKNTPAEITLVGGAAILANYGFRDKTYDVDAIIRASSAMKDAANRVGDKFNLPNNWFNSDFENTASYTPRLRQYSEHYRTYSNIVDFRTISGEYLMAMKLMSGRPYKHDLSDVAEIFAEHKKKGNPIPKEKVITAITDLYDNTDKIPEASLVFLDKIYQCQNIELLIQEQKEYEKQAKNTLITFEKEYKNVLREDNLSDILNKLNEKSITGTDALSKNDTISNDSVNQSESKNAYNSLRDIIARRYDDAENLKHQTVNETYDVSNIPKTSNPYNQ